MSSSASSSSSSAASSASSSTSASSSSSSAASSSSSSASVSSSSSSTPSSGSSIPPTASSIPSVESPGPTSPPAGNSSSSAASPGPSSPPAGSSSSTAASPGSSSAASSNSGGISSKAIATTAASTVVGAILLTLIAVLIIKLIRRNKMKESTKLSTIEGATKPSVSLLNKDSNIVLFPEDISNQNPRRYSSKELKEITGNYTKELGVGTFGRVYEGRLKKCEMLVAVKVFQGSVDSSVEAQFIAEVGTMYRTNHINLVKLLGFCFDVEVKALVCEYMDNGSLDHYLSGKKGWLEFEKLYEIAVGTARGIRYLHEECHKMIIHYDIKPGNVLLGRDFSPKVGDFGLVELLDRGSIFAAPEVAFSFTRKSDVYSFGMLLFQILGSKRNIEGKRAEIQLTPRRVWDNISKGGVASILSLCGIEDDNRKKAERMCRVALMCVRYQSETRPSISDVLKMLEVDEEIGETVSPFNIWVPTHAYRETDVSAGEYQPIESSSK